MTESKHVVRWLYIELIQLTFGTIQVPHQQYLKSPITPFAPRFIAGPGPIIIAT